MKRIYSGAAGRLASLAVAAVFCLSAVPQAVSAGEAAGGTIDAVYYVPDGNAAWSVLKAAAIPEGTPPAGASPYGLDPGVPDRGAWPRDAVSFAGWYTDPDGARNPKDPLSETMLFDFASLAPLEHPVSLYAGFYADWIVDYLNADGVVIQSDFCAPGSPLPAFRSHGDLQTPSGDVLAGWVSAGGEDISQIQPVSRDLSLIPVFLEARFVRFSLQGGEAAGFLGGGAGFTFVPDGARLTEPERPVKTGYLFTGWHTGSPAGVLWDFENGTVEGTLLLCAGWEPDPAARTSYTVVRLLEIPGAAPGGAMLADDASTDPAALPEHFAYADHRVVSGVMVDSPVSPSAALMGRAYHSFTVQTSLTAAGDGSTVVNQYYKRTVYTFSFRLGAGGSMTMAGVTYSGDLEPVYRFRAKFGEDISERWPVMPAASFSNTNGSLFFGWPDARLGVTVFVSRRLEVDSELLDGANQAGEVNYSARWIASGRRIQVNYCFERLEGEAGSRESYGRKSYLISGAYSQQLVTGDDYLLPKQIIGMTSVVARSLVKAPDGSFTAGPGDQWYLFYDRTRWSLTLNAGTGTAALPPPPDGVTKSSESSYSGIMYGQDMSWLGLDGPDSGIVLTHPPDDGMVMVFAGWYLDAGLTRPFDWSGTMPASDLMLFAKWVAQDLEVSFHPDVNSDEVFSGYPAKVAPGSPVTSVPPIVAGEEVWLRRTPQGWVKGGASDVRKGIFSGWAFETAQGGTRVLVPTDPLTWTVSGNLRFFAFYKTAFHLLSYDAADGFWAAGDEDGDGVVTAGGSFAAGTYARLLSGAGEAMEPDGLQPPEGTVFAGWERAGRMHYPADPVQVTSGMVFRAVYLKDTSAAEVVYDANDGSGVTRQVRVSAETDHTALGAREVLSGAGWSVKPTYAFRGWNLEARAGDGAYRTDSSLNIQPGTPVPVPASGLVLFAQWETGALKVTFDKNAALAADPVPGSKEVILGGRYGELAVTSRAGYRFAGWFTLPDGGDQAGEASIVTASADHSLYAHWDALFTVSYDMNGGEYGSGPAPGPILVTADESFLLPGREGFDPAGMTRAGYTFAGFIVAEAGGRDGNVQSADTYAALAPPGAEGVTLRAVWTGTGPVTSGGPDTLLWLIVAAFSGAAGAGGAVRLLRRRPKM